MKIQLWLTGTFAIELIILHNYLRPVMGFDVIWCTYEWQQRGSVHVHGLVWVSDCPIEDVEGLTAKVASPEMDCFMSNDVTELCPDDTHESTILKNQVTYFSGGMVALVRLILQFLKVVNGTHAFQTQGQGAQHVVPSEFLRNEGALPPPASFDYQPIALVHDSLKHSLSYLCRILSTTTRTTTKRGSNRYSTSDNNKYRGSSNNKYRG
eukprot:GHVR01128461.1.p1 GENE.GHVR01128461.1~~GHVR01128461.1.p1  ORF type:complete len:209 (+),score=16.86 GHVR01128461.1:189-815(+)